jgi:hypothetical protein
MEQMGLLYTEIQLCKQTQATPCLAFAQVCFTAVIVNQPAKNMYTVRLVVITVMLMEVSSLQGCDAMLIGMQLPVFWNSLLPPSSRSQ